ncbi:MAG: HpcH/HpaI aldolase family protein [Planctomycetota bacterium]
MMTGLRTTIACGATTRGVFLCTGSAVAAELAGLTGFDWALIDMEHGLGDEAATLTMIRALAPFGTAPLVRIAGLRAEYVKRALDFGAAGICCPMIRSAEEATELVACMRYPPRGCRGLSGSSRAAGYGCSAAAYLASADDSLLGVVQIECRDGLEAIDEIAAVDGVDVIFIGHSDLSQALGCYGDFGHSAMRDAEGRVLAAAERHGKCVGMLLKRDMEAGPYRARGFRFLACGTDVGCLRIALGEAYSAGDPTT